MERKPRVLQICHDFKGPFATVARQYAGSFGDCDVRTVFLRGAESPQIVSAVPGEVEFLMLEKGALRGLKFGIVAQLEALIGNDVPDIVIAHRYKPFYLSMLLNRKMDIGLVLGVMHEFGFLKRKTRSVFSRFWKDNVSLLGVSHPVCDEVRTSHPHLADRIHRVPHAIEAGTLLDSVSARHQLGIPLGAYCYGTIGRLVPKKNHALLIDAFAKLGDNSVLALVGDGELREQLREQAARLRIADRVIFAGSREDAKKYMKAFDSFVLPSTREEAFGMVLLEAMAASTPVLCSDAPGPASVVTDAGIMFRCGDVADLAEKLKKMQTLSKQEQSELSTKAHERLGAEFSVAAMLQNLRTLPQVEKVAPVPGD